MAIAYVSYKIAGSGSSVSSRTSATGAAFTAGNCLICAGGWAHIAGTPVVTTNGGSGTDTFTPTSFFGNEPSAAGSNHDYGIWILPIVGTGRTSITMTYSGNTAFGDFIVWEVSGLPNCVLDKTAYATGNSGDPMTSGNTATLSQANEFCIGYAAGNNTSAVTATPAPWTFTDRTVGTASTGEQAVVATNAPVASALYKGSNSTWFTFAATFMTPSTASVVLGDYAIDAGLSNLDTLCDKMYVCGAAPTSYADATSGANSLGSKNWGAGSAFGSPAARSGGGRQITSTAITDGTISTAGTVAYWAAVDSANSRLLAYGSLTGGAAVTVGQIFTLSALTFGIPNT